MDWIGIMKFHKIILAFILLTSITLEVQAKPKVGGRGIHGGNGAVGGVGVQTDKGQGGCGGIGGNGQAIAGCQGNYNNSETGVNRSGTGGVRYNQGVIDSQTESNGTRRDGSTFKRSTTGNYDVTEQEGNRQVQRQGQTQQGTEYNVDKNSSYDEGEFCRTVTGEAGTYQYNNSGQLSCQ